MRKFIIGLIALVVVALAAALIGPSFVDWNKYKPEIAERVKAATGREITIAGDISLRILPAPKLSVRDVTLANLSGASEPNMATLEALGVSVAFGPLLRGRIKVESISLVEPVITLEVLPDGRRNWDFKPGQKPAAAESGTEAPEAPAKGGGAVGVEIESFSIENGTLTYLDTQKGTIERVEKLNAEIAASSLSGPFSAEGSLVARGIKLAFDGDVGRLDGTEIPVKLALDLPDADAGVKVTGALSAPTADGKLTGKLEAQADSLARVAQFAGATGPLPPPLAQEFSAAANLSASAQAVTLKELKLSLGDTLASGSVAVAPGPPLKADAVITMTSLEIDPWMAGGEPAKKAAEKTDAKEDGKKAPPPAAAFSIPKGVAASLDLSIDAAVYRRDLIRNVKLQAALADGKVTLKRAGASLPGNSSVSASGVLASEQGKPVFSGSVEALSDNLRGALDWLKVDVSAVPAERLRKFSLTSSVKGSPQQIDVTGVVAKLDASELKGGVTIALRERPAFGARIAIDRLNLDGYMPEAPAEGAEAGAKPAPEAKPPAKPAEGGGVPAGLAALNAFDANLQGSIGSLTLRGLQVANIGFDGTLQNGVLTVRDASVGDFGGGSAKVSGVLSGLGGKPDVDAAFDVRVKDPARLMRLAEREPPPVLTRLGPMSLVGKAKGALDGFTFNAGFDAAGGKINAQGNAGLADTGPRYDVAIDAKHGDLPALVRVFNPDYRPAAANLGGLSLAVRAKGDPSMAELSDLDAKVGPVSVQGAARARFDGPRPAFNATLRASEIIADLFLPPKQAGAGGGGKKADGGAPAAAQAPGSHWSKEPFDFAAFKAADAEVKLAAAAIAYDKYRVDKPEVGLSLKDGVLDVRDLKGTMFQGAFSMNGKLDASAVPALSGNVTVSKANIKEALFTAGNINVAEGMLDFGMNVTGSGASPFDLVSALNGKGSMQVLNGAVNGFDLSAVSDRLNNIDSYIDILKFLGTSMSGGQTKFSKLAGTFVIDKGVARTNDLEMLADAATGKGEGYVDLPKWYIDMNSKFTLTKHPDVPPFGMRVVGPLNAPERKFDTKALEALGVQKGVGTLLKKVLPGKEGEAEPGAATEKPLETLLKKVVPGEQAPAAPAPTAPAETQPAPAPEAPTGAPSEKPLETLLKKVVPQQEAPAQPAPTQPAPAPEQPAATQPAPTQPQETAPPPAQEQEEAPLGTLFKKLLEPSQEAPAQ